MKKLSLAIAVGIVTASPAAFAVNNTNFDNFTPLTSNVPAGSLPETAPLALSNPAFTQSAIVINNSTKNFGDNWDMIDTNRTGPDAGRYLFTPYETGAAGVMRVDTWTNTAETIIAPGTQGFVSGDASRWTPWGTYLTAEESWGTGSTKGRLFEVVNPLAAAGTVTMVNRTTALPNVSHEGLAFDAARNLYFIDEANNASIYKFTSTNPFATNGNDYFAAGQTFALKTASGKTGAATWTALTGVTGALLGSTASADLASSSFDGRKAADLVGATDYNRPEDLELQTVNGQELLYVATTTDHDVYAINLTTNTVNLFASQASLNLATGSAVGGSFLSPDNMAIDADNNMYIIEDQPGGQADIWFALDLNKDGDLVDAGEGLSRWASLSTVGAEPTGLYFDIFNPNVAYVNVQHANSDKDTMLKLTAPGVAVAEPATAGLLVAGLLGLFGVRRSRKSV